MRSPSGFSSLPAWSHATRLRRRQFLAPVPLTPLSLVTGQLIAFLAARVWTNLDRANSYVTEAAGAMREAALLAGALPAQTGDMVRAGLQQHLHYVETQDRPEMLAGTASVRQPPPALSDDAGGHAGLRRDQFGTACGARARGRGDRARARGAAWPEFC